MADVQAPEAAAPEPTGPLDIFKVISESLPPFSDAAGAADAELLFVGSKGAGKSTVIHGFLQKDEAPKPSTPLEYRFARRAAGSGATVANIWELAGGFSQLLKVVLPARRLARSVVAITLDLSEPESALGTLLQWLGDLRQHVDSLIAELNQTPEGQAIVAEARKASRQVWAEHPDADVAAIEAVQPVGIPIVILANKWDAFEEAYTEAEYRKCVCRTLRFFAHEAGASLISTKHKDKPSLSVLRSLLYHHVFGSAAIRTVQLDHSRPLVVPATVDSFAGIGKPPTVDGVFADTPGDKVRAALPAVHAHARAVYTCAMQRGARRARRAMGVRGHGPALHPCTVRTRATAR